MSRKGIVEVMLRPKLVDEQSLHNCRFMYVALSGLAWDTERRSLRERANGSSAISRYAIQDHTRPIREPLHTLHTDGVI